LQRLTKNACSTVTGPPSWDDDIHALLREMTCACARTGPHLDAPIARALFFRVDVLNEPPKIAARALGVHAGDAAYLLTGLRKDLATQLATVIGDPSVAQT